jgi:hypothetical protein
VPISIDWGTKVISVPQSYLTPLGGDAYELDVDAFRLDLKDLEDDEEGMPFPDTHRHNTEVTLSGVTYARTVEIINGYVITFETGGYVVVCSGANHNIADVFTNLTGPSLVVNNAAGLIVTGTSGLTAEESAALTFIADIEGGRWKIDEVAKQMIFYEDDNVTEVARFNLLDSAGAPTGTPSDAYERTRA